MRTFTRVMFVCCLAGLMLAWSGCHQTAVKPYNLIISDGIDPNGLLFNPMWGYQFDNPGQFPIPLPSPNDPWTSSQTDWVIGAVSGAFCDGHRNWMSADLNGRVRAGTYMGLLTWESHSGSWPFDDDDYSFNLEIGRAHV